MILLRCGHWLPDPAVAVRWPGPNRWRDRYACPAGCGLQQRESNTDKVRAAKAARGACKTG